LGRILKASPKAIHIAAERLKAGDLVAFPTETVYGLGANAFNEEAVARIFAVKQRPLFVPLIVHLASLADLPVVAEEIPEVVGRLKVFWPGPLTLLLRKRSSLPDIVTAGLPTVAVRLPRNEVALALIKECGFPLAAPSANSFGRPSPTSPQHVLEDLGGEIDLILDGGETAVGVESTVLDLTCQPPVILRPGGISREALEEVLGEVRLASEEDLPRSPGQLWRHYAPRAEILLYRGKTREAVIAAMQRKILELRQGGHRVGLLVGEEDLAQFSGEGMVVESLGNSPDEAARRLFSALRALEKQGVEFILAPAPPRQGMGLAVFDRLLRAAGSKLIEVKDGT